MCKLFKKLFGSSKVSKSGEINLLKIQVKELREMLEGKPEDSEHFDGYRSMFSFFPFEWKNPKPPITKRIDAIEKYLKISYVEEKKEFNGYKPIVEKKVNKKKNAR